MIGFVSTVNSTDNIVDIWSLLLLVLPTLPFCDVSLKHETFADVRFYFQNKSLLNFLLPVAFHVSYFGPTKRNSLSRNFVDLIKKTCTIWWLILLPTIVYSKASFYISLY